ncbi:MAG: cysteine desulfurase [Tepidanaerobacteraceae bacterium]|nr:cysteine desulfurase [Tepidanaerobacteraceae bacterium]
MREIYLDNSATTRVSDRVAQIVYHVMTQQYGNPSSLHRKGIEAEKIMRKARETIAHALGVKPSEVYFTSGGTESNNLAIKGTAYSMRRMGNHLITTSVEHPSVLDTFKQLEKEGFCVTYLGVNKEGFIELDELQKALRKDTILVSIMYVNNEVGSIQPVEEAADHIHRNKNTIFHVDAVQALGKIPLVPALKGIDMLSISGHKIYGPKGIGALFVRENVKLYPIFNGGGQERGIRSGTENVPGIAGFGAAVEDAMNSLFEWRRTMEELKNRLCRRILEEIPDTVLNGPRGDYSRALEKNSLSSDAEGFSASINVHDAAPHILNISFLGVRGEILLHSLESHGIYVSTGSACSSNKSGKSHVLSAMGKTAEEIDGAIRFSLSPFLTLEDIDYTVEILKKEVAEIRKFVRR